LIIYPLIKKEFMNEGGSMSLNIFGHQVEMDPKFKLFIVSELKNPKFGPDISVLTT
jgi:ATP-binding dynein motor region